MRNSANLVNLKEFTKAIHWFVPIVADINMEQASDAIPATIKTNGKIRKGRITLTGVEGELEHVGIYLSDKVRDLTQSMCNNIALFGNRIIG